MSTEDSPGYDFGRRVAGPVVAEFCLRLWTLTSSLERPDEAVLAFCARGGLRLQLCLERFAAATGLDVPLSCAPLMVSRLVALRSAIAAHAGNPDTLGPAARSAVSYEFGWCSVARAAEAISGVSVAGDDRWQQPCTPDALAALLGHRDGAEARAAIAEQAQLFGEHLGRQVGGRRRAILVDTGRFGTTRELLQEAEPDIDFTMALMARSFRPGSERPTTYGLLFEGQDYSLRRPRSALLRHWHFVEWLFEPPLPSVSTFSRDGDRVGSDLEVPGWQDAVLPSPGSPFAGVIDHLDGLRAADVPEVLSRSDPAWRALRAAVVWPDLRAATALQTERRSHGFGRTESFSEREWTGVRAALRGSTMWREGEIARARTPLRLPLLATIETAYLVRGLSRSGRRRVQSLPVLRGRR